MKSHNRLIYEKSPYLLQRAHNPVDWYIWGEEAFKRARLEDKPIFLSIGYSTCHWCHLVRLFTPICEDSPGAMPLMASAVLIQEISPLHIILLKGERGYDHFLTRLVKGYLPYRTLLCLVSGDQLPPFLDWVPHAIRLKIIRERTTAYVCNDFSCEIPTDSVDKFSELITRI